MIPVKLSLKGLYSYREHTEVDFGRLTEGRLFGIFGAVGSGKSALLEAITYALFGETERLNNRENRGYNMMNLKSSELWIDFEFKIGAAEEDRYRFTVSQKRNSKRFQDVGTAKRVAYSFQDGEWHPLPHTDAGKVLGLSYEHFIKTIIIPQGKFQEFLAMGATDRSRMLKEIFELHRFDLSANTKLLLDRNGDALKTVDGQLKELQPVDANEIAAKEQELLQLEADIDAISKEKTKLDSELKLLELLKNLIDEIEAIHELLDPMEEEVPEFDARALLLKRYEEAQGRFQDLLAARARQETALATHRKAQDELTQSLGQVQLDAQAAQATYQRAREAFDQRDCYRVEAQDWRLISERQRLAADLQAVEKRVNNGRTHVAQETLAVEERRATRLAALEEVARLKAALPDVHQLHACNNWHQEARRLQQAREKAESEAQTTAAALAAAEAAITQLADGPDGDPQTATQALQERRGRIQARIAQWQAHTRLTDFAAALAEGQPCPLCGALSHPQPMDPGDVQEEQAAAAQEAAQVEADIAAQAKRAQALASAQVRHEERLGACTRAKAFAEQAAAQSDAHAGAFIWEAAWRGDAAHVEALLADAKAQITEYEASQLHADKAQAALETAEATLQKYERELNKLELQLAELNARKQAQETQVQNLDLLAANDLDADACQLRATEAEALFHQIGKDHFIAEERLKTQSAALRDAEMALERAKTQAESTASALALATEQLQERLAGSSFADLDEVADTLAAHIDVATEREEIEQFKTMLSEQRNLLRSQLVMLGDQRYDADAHRAMRQSHSILVERMQEASVEKGRLVAQLERVKADQKRRANLEEQATALRDRAADLDVLAKLFKANGFVDYVSSVYLKDLCVAANARFTMLTRNRLRLEVSADNSFEVRDMVNGGELRSVKTLSGGQTFQAALSLALALADSIQQRNRSAYNFFFLDEGFGSLDRESLQIVFDTLKNLQKEDRVVGVISHVEELQLEIGTYLSIRQEDERGSLVTPSWRI